MSDIEAAGQQSFSPRRVIADAARRTGADFDYLMRTAAREGGSSVKTPRPIEEWRIVVKDRYPAYVD